LERGVVLTGFGVKAPSWWLAAFLLSRFVDSRWLGYIRCSDD
jgi:hypothetical protein